jgi:hypothetical protein
MHNVAVPCVSVGVHFRAPAAPIAEPPAASVISRAVCQGWQCAAVPYSSRIIVSITPKEDYKVPQKAAPLNKALLSLYAVTCNNIPNEIHIATADNTDSEFHYVRKNSV